jgi:hypothetical protein
MVQEWYKGNARKGQGTKGGKAVCAALAVLIRKCARRAGQAKRSRLCVGGFFVVARQGDRSLGPPWLLPLVNHKDSGQQLNLMIK